ncbi:MAG: hypothetical protein IJH37_03845 [Clostridia bacterium]|nr:hypothetical protein [Clostridia bacterium]
MKKVISILCAGALVFSSASPVIAAFNWTSELINEFDVYEDFASDDVSLIKNKENWIKSGPGSPSYQDGVLSFSAGTEGETKDTTATRSFDAISVDNTRFAAIDLDFRLNTKTQGMMIYVKGSSDATRIATTLANDKLQLWTNAGIDGETVSSKQALIDDVETGRWYSLSMIYDLVNRKIDYYIDNTIVLENINYFNNTEPDSISSILLGAAMNSGVSFDIKNIKVGAITDKLAVTYDSLYNAPYIAADVTEDIILPVSSKYGSEVTWSSSDPSVLSASGKVHPAAVDPDGTEVTLTQAFIKGSSEYTRDYSVTVYGKQSSDWDVYEAFNSETATKLVSDGAVYSYGTWSKSGYGAPSYQNGVLTIASGDETDTSTKDSNASLKLKKVIQADKAAVELDIMVSAGESPMIYVYDENMSTTISRMQIADSDLYTYSGNARPVLIDDMAKETWYTLGAVYDFTAHTIDFYVDGELKVEDAPLFGSNQTASGIGGILIGCTRQTATTINIRGLKMGAITDKIAMRYDSYYTAPETDLSNVTASVALSTETKYGSSVVWSSSNADVISGEGKVNLKNADPNGEAVTLTALFTRNSETYARKYTAVVYGINENEWAIYENFASETLTKIDKRTINGGEWTKSGSGSGMYDNGILYMTSNAGDAKNTTATLQLDSAVTSSMAVISFDIRLTSGSYPLIYIYDSDNSTLSRIQGRTTDDKTELFMYDTEGVKHVLIADAEQDRWYTLAMIYDITNKTVDYYVGDLLKYSDVGFYNNPDASDIKAIMIGAAKDEFVGTTVNARNLRIGAFTDRIKIHKTYYTDSGENVISKPAWDADSYLNAVVRKPAWDTSKVSLFLAVYDSEDRFIKVFGNKCELTEGETEENLRLAIDGRDLPDNGKYRAFIWRSDDQAPLVLANEMEIGDRDDDAGVSRVPYSGADTVALTAYNAVEDRKKFVIDYYYSTPSVSIDTESAWGYTGYGLAALWKNDSAGNEYIIKACEDYPPAEGVQMTDTYFCMNLLLRAWYTFSDKSNIYPGRLSAEAQAAIEKYFYDYLCYNTDIALAEDMPADGLNIKDSENHDIIQHSSYLVGAELLMQTDAYKDVMLGENSLSDYRDAWNTYLKYYFNQKAKYGLTVETGSPTYAKYYVDSLYTIYDFAGDTELKELTGKYLDVYYADAAMETINGIRGGAKSRAYQNNYAYVPARDATNLLMYLQFGTGSKMYGKKPGAHPALLSAAFTEYTAPYVLFDIMYNKTSDGGFVYEENTMGAGSKTTLTGSHTAAGIDSPLYSMSVPGSTYRKTYVTPDYVMGTQTMDRTLGYTEINSQNKWMGVIFNGALNSGYDSRVFVQGTANNADNSGYNEIDGICVPGAMVISGLPERRWSSNTGARVYVSKDMYEASQTRDGWFFAEDPDGSCYVAIKPASGEISGTTDTDDGKFLTLSDGFVPIVIQVGKKSDYTDIDGFAAAVKANTFEWNDTVFCYTSLNGDTVEVSVEDKMLPKINSESVDVNGDFLVRSPYFNSVYGSGVFNITDTKGHSFVVDFNN